MTEVLTQRELNTAGCDTPNCGHDHTVLYMHQACHMGAALTASYNKTTGLLTLYCAECDDPISDFLLAKAKRHA
jgi:hypothetical protein